MNTFGRLLPFLLRSTRICAAGKLEWLTQTINLDNIDEVDKNSPWMQVNWHVVGKFNVKENPVLELVALAIHKRLTIAPFDFSSSGEKWKRREELMWWMADGRPLAHFCERDWCELKSNQLSRF